MALTLIITVLFMNGERLGIQVITDADAENYAGTEHFTENDLDGAWDTGDATVITLTGDGAEISGNGAYVYDGDVVIVQTGHYVVSGELTDGSIIVDAEDFSKVWILLENASVTCSDDAALRINEADKTFLTLAEGTENHLQSGSEMSEAALKDGTDGAIYAHDDLTINGSGSLTVSAEYRHGIEANDELTITGGTISITAPEDGINVNEEFCFTNASLVISAGDDAIHSDKLVYVEDGTITIEKCYEGLEAMIVEIHGGEITICPTDDGINANGGGGDNLFGMGGGMMPHMQDGFPAPESGEMPEMPDGAPAPESGERPEMPDSAPEGGEMPQMPQGGPGEMAPGAQMNGETAEDSESASETEAVSPDETYILITGGKVTIINTEGSDADGLDSNDNITITGGEVTSTSTEDAAGLGSGNSAPGGVTIKLSNANVNASCPQDGSGIGTGDEADSAANITITNCVIIAHGGRYGAGIGGGDAVSGGTIVLENCPKIVAESKTDGAGIGGGEGGDGGNITIRNCPDIQANGGGYAAGIGGGDDADGDTVVIENSTVKARGGTDAAGIGGGEDGNGGRIEIRNSNVYAEGKSYGAGIGAGEDADGGYCSIDGNSTVEAVAGKDGLGISIGYGDYNSFAGPSAGTLSLSSTLKVKAGSGKDSVSEYKGSSRYDAVWNSKYAKIYPCEHSSSTEYQYYDSYDHARFCAECGSIFLESKQRHDWVDGTCTVCGVHSEPTALKFIEQSDSGERITELQVPLKSDYIAPECQNTPTGSEFVCWKSNGIYYAPGDVISFIEDKTLTAVYLQTADTTYIDKNGAPATVRARVLTNSDLCLTSGHLYQGSGRADTRRRKNNDLRRRLQRFRQRHTLGLVRYIYLAEYLRTAKSHRHAQFTRQTCQDRILRAVRRNSHG